MAGRNFTVSEFRRVGREFLNLERIDLFPIGPGRVRESLPRVTLFRAADLLSVRLSFVGLSLTDGPDGKVLHRSAGATTGYLSLHFGGQHLHERVFFESSEGIKVATPASSTEQPPRPPDPDADPPSPQPPKSNETPLRPPVPTRIAGASRLVFRVTEERIPWSLEGILAAIGTLPLSVAPHAVAAPSVFLPPIIDLATPNFADLAGPGNRRVAGSPGPSTPCPTPSARPPHSRRVSALRPPRAPWWPPTPAGVLSGCGTMPWRDWRTSSGFG